MFQATLLPFWQYGAVVVLAVVTCNALYTRYASPLRKFPGPFLASITRGWQMYIASTGYAEQVYMQLHEDFGPIVRIGPNEVSFASPLAGQQLFKTGKGFHKSDFYTVFLPDGRKDIFTEIREDRHALKKRFAVPPYSLAAVKQHNSGITESMQLFLSKLDRYAESKQQNRLDLGNWLHFLAFDVLGVFAFDTSFGFLDHEDDRGGAITAISQSTYESGIIGQMPFVDVLTRRSPIFQRLPFLPVNRAQMFLDVCRESLERFQKPTSDAEMNKCLLKSLLDTHKQNPDKFTLDDVTAISMGAVAAGSDSTASTVQTFVSHVLANPGVYKTLVAELDAADLSDIAEYEEVQSLTYFQACLKEAMRLQPAVGFNMTRIVPLEGANLNGTWLPGGTQVAVNAWTMHRDRNVFGAAPDKFRPERWLETTPEGAVRMERSMFQFGGGSHQCIGRHLAMFEMNKILPTIFRRYDMSLGATRVPLPRRTGFFYIQSGLMVTLSKRSSLTRYDSKI